MNYVLFDGDRRDALLPFTYTRPVADIRIGILTIREKWEFFLKTHTSTITENYLAEKFPYAQSKDNILINSSFLPNEGLVKQILNLEENQVIVKDNKTIAFRTKNAQKNIDFSLYEQVEFTHKCLTIENTWDIFTKNDKAIESDFNLITKRKTSLPIPKSVNAIARENIFIEEGAKLEFVTLNASTGVIYIGKNSEIMENSAIRGPFALGENAQIKMGTKIYGATTVGKNCKIGGEVSNSVFMGNSNKGHDGFLGNSILGEWCNIGAGTNSSNLKNNYQKVKLWNYSIENFEKTELQFCGLIMGDHSKCGINTMFNTATSVGVSANIFGSGFPSNFIPSFTWNGTSETNEYLLEKAIQTAQIAMSRRGENLSEQDIKILKHIFEITRKYS